MVIVTKMGKKRHPYLEESRRVSSTCRPDPLLEESSTVKGEGNICPPSPGGRELIPHKIKDFVGAPGSLPNRRFGRVEGGGG